MDGKELLELAAKAAGMKGTMVTNSVIRGGMTFASSDGHKIRHWNPLVSDSDALRLAVKLHIDIRHFMYRDIRMDCLVDRLGRGFAEDVDPNDPCTATRRAIVRAAAEIGKSVVTPNV